MITFCQAVVKAAESLAQQADCAAVLVCRHSRDGHSNIGKVCSQGQPTWLDHLWLVSNHSHQVPVDIIVAADHGCPSGRGVPNPTHARFWHLARLARMLPVLAEAKAGPMQTVPGAKLSKWSLTVPRPLAMQHLLHVGVKQPNVKSGLSSDKSHYELKLSWIKYIHYPYSEYIL